LCWKLPKPRPNQRQPHAPQPRRAAEQDNSQKYLDAPVFLESGLITHLTSLTRLCFPSSPSHDTRWHDTIRVPNDPDVLPSAGGSLRALVLPCDPGGRVR
jgi:hypothetical protein